jgi:hypothetical protein
MKSDFLSALPEPHILDYDWRYTAATVIELGELVRPSDSVLAVGAPSIARHLENLGRDVVLVDRQPIHAVRNHLQVEPGFARSSLPTRSLAIVDPPWYPADARRWIAWAAQSVALHERILVSLWPDSTRPNAAREFNELNSWIGEWADIEIVPIIPRYESPPFERAALHASEERSLALSPGYGRLLNLRSRHIPPIVEDREPRKTWIRFVVDDYQLAVCLSGEVTTQAAVDKHPLAKGWIWPYVSKRAPRRDEINLWSSRNEVAIVRDPHLLADTLRRAFKARGAEGFDAQLGAYTKLSELDIPRPPYRRSLEWRHQQ